jgi:hypothetical protein
MKEIKIKIYNMFLSLSSTYEGNACAIKQSIDTYYLKGETHFFDWLVCSMKSVNEVLDNKPILFEDKYIYPNPLNTTSINFLDFHLLTSHHDIVDYNSETVSKVIEKYKRRYDRLINTIKTEKNIYFIRYCKDAKDIEVKEIIYFFRKIKEINYKLVFKFILISDCNNLIVPNTLKNTTNFIYIDLNDYIDEDITNESDKYLKIVKKYKCLFNVLT